MKVIHEVKEEGKEVQRREIEVEVPGVKTLEESVQVHGKEAVHKAFVAKAETALRSLVTSLLAKNKPEAEIRKAVSEFRVTTRGKRDPLEMALKAFQGLSAEQQKQVLERMRKAA